MQIETADDRLKTFFTLDFASDCILTGPAGFTATIPVIMNTTTDPVSLYETNVEAAHPNFICRLEDVAGVNRALVRQYQALIEGVTYRLERLTDDQDGFIVTAYLKK